jgi:hypothetical protein
VKKSNVPSTTLGVVTLVAIKAGPKDSYPARIAVQRVRGFGNAKCRMINAVLNTGL